jgi:signal transduction histidine kinase
MAADLREAVSELAVGAAAELLAPDVGALYLFDENSGLDPVASVTDVDGLPTIAADDRTAWRVWDRGDVVVRDGIDGDPDTFGPPTRSELYLPVGAVGVLVSGSEATDAFDKQDVAVGRILASTVATALEQVQRTEQLRARRRELARQNERLEEFASVVSHDLRNPLNVARGRFELATEGRDGEHVAAVERAHERMSDLIDDLLTLARGGDSVGDAEPVPLADVVRNCWRTVDTADATIHVDAASAVYADRSRLQQLLENFLRNSVEHGGDGVTVTVGELDDGFYVADDGPGIPAGERENVFDAGYSTSTDGTGFGLSIVREVADAHGWTVRAVESDDGGARFEVTGVEFVDSLSP